MRIIAVSLMIFSMLKTIARVSVLLALIVSVELFYGWAELFALIENLARENENSLFIFFLLMSIGCACAFPLSFCYLFAGVAFGFCKGWSVCVAILAVSSSIGYFIGRFAIPEKTALLIRKKFGVGDLLNGRSIFNANFFVRVVPGIPYVVQNILLGGIRSYFPLYIAVNLVAQGAIAGAMNYMASSVNEDGYGKYVAFALLFVVLAIFHILTNIAYKKMSRKVS